MTGTLRRLTEWRFYNEENNENPDYLAACRGYGERIFRCSIRRSRECCRAIEGTWNAAETQIKQVVNNVVFPIIDLVLAVFFFAKLGLAYFDYRKSGHFEWTAPAILFACLVFTMTAPLYIWQIIGGGAVMGSA